VSRDGKDWGSAVSEGRFPNSGSLQTVRWDERVTGRYIRLVAVSEWSGEYYTSVAEIDVMAAR
jgi:beta-galactosidase